MATSMTMTPTKKEYHPLYEPAAKPKLFGKYFSKISFPHFIKNYK